jgi:hypothetical protein
VEIVAYWSFRDYVEGGQDPVQGWHTNDLSDGGRFLFNAALKNAARTKSELGWSGFKYLKGEPSEEKIWQLDFFADGKQYRLLGVFRPARQAVLLIGCYHKGKVYTPQDAIGTATKRAKALREKKPGVAISGPRKIRFDL